MRLLEPETIKAGPAFVLPMREQYEVRAAVPVIRALRREFPEAPIYGLLSNSHETQATEAQARDWLGEQASAVTFHRGLETDLAKAGAPTIRLRVPMLFYSMKPEDEFIGKWENGQYILAVNPELLKFDVACRVPDERKQRLRQEMGLTRGQFVVVAGSLSKSTPNSVSIEKWVAYHLEVTEKNPGADMVSIIAPRNPKDPIPEQAGSQPILRLTELRAGKAQPPQRGSYVVVADTWGELPELYSIADVAFVNMEHNILEPAEQGAPVIYMRGNQSFPRSVNGLEKAGGGIPLKHSFLLPERIGGLLTHPYEAKTMGAKAKRFKDENSGVTERLMQHLRQKIDEYQSTGKRADTRIQRNF